MRFQTTKRVQGQDPELVLGALEGCLRSLSNEVVRQGSQITLLGLGPSPRAVNRRDTTVIDVKREDGAAVIHADVRFQASAFLGMAAQDVVVKEKLDRIFDDMLARLGLSGSANGSEKVDKAAEAASGVEHPAANSAEAAVAQEELTSEAVSEQPVPEAIRDDRPAAKAAVQPDIPAAAENVAASEPISEAVEEVNREVNLAAEPAVSPEVPANESKEPVIVLQDKRVGEEKLAEAVEAIPASEVKRPDVVEASAAGRDSGTSVDTPNANAAAEIVTATTDASVAVGKSGPSTKSADAAPVLPPAEAAKPLSVSVAALSAQPQKSAESPKNAAEEKKPVPPVKKPGAASLNALSVASPQRDSIAIKPPKPAAPRAAAVAKASSSSQLPEPAKGTFGAFGIEDELEAGSKWLKWSAWVAALIVLVIAPLVWLYMPSHPESAAPVTQPAPAAAAPAPAPQPPVLARQAGDDPDPAMVVSDWEAAMNSRDAAAQAAFYADPVDRYFLRHNLSRDEVKADKQSAINRRKGDWSVEMENVKVTRPADNTARARLIKHYTVKEEGKTASEWFVPSLLLMTRANGRWQITSERDLGWATSMEELGN